VFSFPFSNRLPPSPDLPHKFLPRPFRRSPRLPSPRPKAFSAAARCDTPNCLPFALETEDPPEIFFFSLYFSLLALYSARRAKWFSEHTVLPEAPFCPTRPTAIFSMIFHPFFLEDFSFPYGYPDFEGYRSIISIVLSHQLVRFFPP